ncbi:MAG: Crp/Fnr family transcriptional regulator [Deltaproteobacteria bacterium]|jgi:CRP-like cAMP-binding protein
MSSRLSASAIERIADAARVISTGASRFIYREKKQAKYVYVLCDGGVQMQQAGPKREPIVTQLFKAPALFGHEDVLAGEEWAHSVMTVNESVLLEVPRALFCELVATEPQFGHAILRDLARRVQLKSNQVRETVADSTERRVASFLVDHAELFGVEVPSEPGAIRIDAPINQSSIARSLGLSRKTLQRVLGAWLEFGWIARAGRRLIVLDLEAVRALTSAQRAGLACHQEAA